MHVKVIELLILFLLKLMCITDFIELSIHFLSYQQFKMKLFLKVAWNGFFKKYLLELKIFSKCCTFSIPVIPTMAYLGLHIPLGRVCMSSASVNSLDNYLSSLIYILHLLGNGYALCSVLC